MRSGCCKWRRLVRRTATRMTPDLDTSGILLLACPRGTPRHRKRLTPFRSAAFRPYGTQAKACTTNDVPACRPRPASTGTFSARPRAGARGPEIIVPTCPRELDFRHSGQRQTVGSGYERDSCTDGSSFESPVPGHGRAKSASWPHASRVWFGAGETPAPTVPPSFPEPAGARAEPARRPGRWGTLTVAALPACGYADAYATDLGPHEVRHQSHAVCCVHLRRHA